MAGNVERCPPHVASIIAAGDSGFAGPLKLQNSVPQLIEQGWRKHSIGVTAVGARSNIVARPKEAVQLVKAYPVPAFIEAESSANHRRNLDRCCLVGWWAMGDRSDNGADVAIRVRRRGNDDRARTILCAFDFAGEAFGTPKKIIANDQTRFRKRQAHFGSTPYSADSIEAMVSSSSSPTIRISRSRRFSNS